MVRFRNELLLQLKSFKVFKFLNKFDVKYFS
jgi:hypothetical protein